MTSRAVKPGQLITSQGEDAIDETKEIAIRLNLPGAKLDFTNDWVVDTTELEQAKAMQATLMARIQALEQENQYLREKCDRIHDESNLDKFKSQLLVEMLAVSSLDEEKSKAEYIKEKLKVESLKQDMKALLEAAAKHNIDIKQFAVALKAV
ncbi:unnamed protein product [Aphanomyces euteiches]|uniref:Uncharacterized protein n=1 Tax=Aphanomyces euteiches TaxID=100861 RepID=A0A6G0XAQ3_9STRA|nr:hypothetical protein Ae201684_006918 [Aphanomyces euteiches]KAH9125003.1 hypothetical protein AeMF1_004321 [Aphanomyces euteiches]KAH9131247.1 hypothetical protein LEN26_007807 [Aphanomyces euteiches]KAH9132106.1 hypothetical protein AeRB84_021373 [Aphanomyces euteiches]KAH9184712.1 hypothetical protein AeNC1_013315 [Aphanomyces euteiches]